MMFALFLLLCIFVRSENIQEESLIEKFKHFKQEFGKKYSNPSEEKLRFEIFKENLKFIEEMNSKRIKKSDAIFGINKFTDKTNEELPKNYQQIISIEETESIKTKSSIIDESRLTIHYKGELPKNLSYCGSYTKYNSIDDKNNYCGDTYDQGSCGCCYAAAQANLGQFIYAKKNFKKNGNIEILNFGVQLYLNNTKEDGYTLNKRCCGGTPVGLYSTTPYYFLEEDDPFQEYNHDDKNYCSPVGIQKSVPKKLKVDKFHLFGLGRGLSNKEYFENLKMVLHEYGPFTAAVRTGDQIREWSSYKSGLFMFSKSNCAMSLQNKMVTDHQITVVGYGTTEGDEDYLIIRNSWGNSWGENGYMRIAADNEGVAFCGIGWNYDSSSVIPNSGVVSSDGYYGVYYDTNSQPETDSDKPANSVDGIGLNIFVPIIIALILLI